MTYVIPVTQARKDFLSLIDKIDSEYTRVDITKMGTVRATIVSPEYLDSLEETLYSLSHSMKDMRAAEKKLAEGKYVTLEQLKKDLRARTKRHARQNADR